MFSTIPYERPRTASPADDEARIFLYGLSFCDHCAQARAFLEELGVDFSYTQIDRLEPEVRRPVLARFRQIYGKPVIYPVLEIDGEFTFGFSEEIWSGLLHDESQ